jgi:hypothetical protein
MLFFKHRIATNQVKHPLVFNKGCSHPNPKFTMNEETIQYALSQMPSSY